LGKSSPSVPNQPSAAETAAAQGQSNSSTAATQAALNYVNQNTPYGSTYYAQTGTYTNPQGDTVPTYTENVSLSPLGQSILSGQQNVANTLLPTANTLAGQTAAAMANPLNFNTADSAILNTAPQVLDQNVANSIYNTESSFLNPQWDQQQTNLQDQLSRQGIGIGSDAYNNAEKQFDNAKTQAYQSAASNALTQGMQGASQQFGLAQLGQQQNIQQQQLAQTQPLSDLSALFGATPATPTQPIATPGQTSVAPTDVVGANASANNAAMQAYQAQVAQQNSMYGGLASLGSAGIMALALS
jgi:hypothetical protein